MDYSTTIKEALSTKVLSDETFAFDEAKQMRAIDSFDKDFADEVDISNGSHSAEFLLRYLMQPQLVEAKFYKDTNGFEYPAYKTNERLAKLTLRYAEDNNMSGFVEKFIKELEHYASGKDTEIDISSYDRSIPEAYDWSQLGGMASPVRSLVKYLDTFHSSPYLEQKLMGMTPTSQGRTREIDLGDRQKTMIRFPRSFQKNRWDMIQESMKGCVG
jgi:hypothetical protein